MTGLPWDDPNRDIAADMLTNIGRRYLDAYGGTVEHAVDVVGGRLSQTFSFTTASADAAIAALHAERTPPPPQRKPGPAWKRAARHTALGGPVTQHDLDVDLVQVADDAEALLRQRQNARARFNDHIVISVIEWIESRRRYRDALWEQAGRFVSRPRGGGKSEEARQTMLAWARYYQEVVGEWPNTVVVGGGRAITVDPDMLFEQPRPAPRMPDDEVDDAQMKMMLGHMDRACEQLAARSGVPMHLINPWYTLAAPERNRAVDYLRPHAWD